MDEVDKLRLEIFDLGREIAELKKKNSDMEKSHAELVDSLKHRIYNKNRALILWKSKAVFYKRKLSEAKEFLEENELVEFERREEEEFLLVKEEDEDGGI